MSLKVIIDVIASIAYSLLLFNCGGVIKFLVTIRTSNLSLEFQWLHHCRLVNGAELTLIDVFPRSGYHYVACCWVKIDFPSMLTAIAYGLRRLMDIVIPVFICFSVLLVLPIWVLVWPLQQFLLTVIAYGDLAFCRQVVEFENSPVIISTSFDYVHIIPRCWIVSQKNRLGDIMGSHTPSLSQLHPGLA